MVTQKQRSDTTRALLLKAFKSSFLKNGLDRTTTQSVLNETGLSKGAMYHHFKSKTDIVEAIYEEESRSAINRALATVADIEEPLTKLKGACLAWTKEVRVRNVSKILFEIGPTALGPEKAKAIEDSNSFKFIEDLLEDAMDRGDLRRTDPKLIAAFLNALVEESALYSLRTKKASLDVLDGAIQALFDSLRS